MIHKYKMNGLNIVLDVNSGSVHGVDEVTYDIIDLVNTKTEVEIVNQFKDKYNQEEIKSSIKEILELKESGLMFSKDLAKEMLPTINKRKPVVKALCLHIAHDCNLTCKYCFAQEGEYHGSRSFMSYEVGKKGLDFLVANSGSRVNLEVDFFGGEPLMNFEVVKQLVEYGRELEKTVNKKFRFTLTTNGVLLDDETIQFMNEHMHNVVLSIDGRKEVNDYMRRTLNDKGSYDIIMPKFIQVAQSRNQDNYYVRGTFTRKNLDFSKDVLHLADMGFKQISVEPVIGEDSSEFALTNDNLEQIFNEYENLAIQMIERKEKGEAFNFFHFMIDLTGGPCIAKRLVGCGAGSEYIAVTPTGELFPCHQFVGDDEFLMGTVDTGITNVDKRECFDNCNVLVKEECNNCWAKFYCSGGCAANAHQNNNDILKTYNLGCELQKKRTECAIMLKFFE